MAIQFRNPKLVRMHSGDMCIELTEEGTWESFERFALKWAAQIGAEVLERFDGVDARVWHLLYDSCKVALVYRDYPNGVSVEPMDAGSSTAIEKLFSLVTSEAVPNGV